MAALKVFGLAAVVLAQQAAGNSLYLAKLCRGHVCSEPAFPILDYVEAEDKCICRAHPCWEVDGVKHACKSLDFPFLKFTYDSSRKLTCGCSSKPSYDSLHIAMDLCPGNHCDEAEHPVLDWDESAGQCLCRSHPCEEVEGIRHKCPDSRFPILRYREDPPETPEGQPKPMCDCMARMDQPGEKADL